MSDRPNKISASDYVTHYFKKNVDNIRTIFMSTTLFTQHYGKGRSQEEKIEIMGRYIISRGKEPRTPGEWNKWLKKLVQTTRHSEKKNSPAPQEKKEQEKKVGIPRKEKTQEPTIATMDGKQVARAAQPCAHEKYDIRGNSIKNVETNTLLSSCDDVKKNKQDLFLKLHEDKQGRGREGCKAAAREKWNKYQDILAKCNDEKKDDSKATKKSSEAKRKVQQSLMLLDLQRKNRYLSQCMNSQANEENVIGFLQHFVDKKVSELYQKFFHSMNDEIGTKISWKKVCCNEVDTNIVFDDLLQTLGCKRIWDQIIEQQPPKAKRSIAQVKGVMDEWLKDECQKRGLDREGCINQRARKQAEEERYIARNRSWYKFIGALKPTAFLSPVGYLIAQSCIFELIFAARLAEGKVNKMSMLPEGGLVGYGTEGTKLAGVVVGAGLFGKALTALGGGAAVLGGGPLALLAGAIGLATTAGCLSSSKIVQTGLAKAGMATISNVVNVGDFLNDNTKMCQFFLIMFMIFIFFYCSEVYMSPRMAPLATSVLHGGPTTSDTKAPSKKGTSESLLDREPEPVIKRLPDGTKIFMIGNEEYAFLDAAGLDSDDDTPLFIEEGKIESKPMLDGKPVSENFWVHETERNEDIKTLLDYIENDKRLCQRRVFNSRKLGAESKIKTQLLQELQQPIPDHAKIMYAYELDSKKNVAALAIFEMRNDRIPTELEEKIRSIANDENISELNEDEKKSFASEEKIAILRMICRRSRVKKKEEENSFIVDFMNQKVEPYLKTKKYSYIVTELTGNKTELDNLYDKDEETGEETGVFHKLYFDLIGEKRGDRRRVHRYLYKDIRERDGKNLSGSRIVQQSES